METKTRVRNCFSNNGLSVWGVPTYINILIEVACGKVPLQAIGEGMLCRGEVPSVKLPSFVLQLLCGIGCAPNTIYEATTAQRFKNMATSAMCCTGFKYLFNTFGYYSFVL